MDVGADLSVRSHKKVKMLQGHCETVINGKRDTSKVSLSGKNTNANIPNVLFATSIFPSPPSVILIYGLYVTSLTYSFCLSLRQLPCSTLHGVNWRECMLSIQPNLGLATSTEAHQNFMQAIWSFTREEVKSFQGTNL